MMIKFKNIQLIFEFLIILNVKFIIGYQVLDKVNNSNIVFGNGVSYKFYNYAVKFIDNYEVAFNNSKDDELCLKQIGIIQESVLKKELWAMKVIDSWGSISSSGILYGHLFDIGNYDECLNITQKYSNNQSIDIINGQYCKAEIPLENINELLEFKADVIDTLPKFHLFPMFTGLSFGICIPKTCSATITNILLKDFLNQILKTQIKNTTNIVSEENCRKIEKIYLRPIDYLALVILGLFIFLIVFSTIYDFSSNSTKRLKYFEILTIFSIRKNGKKLFNIQKYNIESTNQITIECLNGLRVITIVWIVYGHEYAFSYGLNFINRIDMVQWAQTPYSMIMQFGSVSVDTFFLLSGCLLTLTAFKEMNENKGKLNIPLMYLHRYIRLTPIVAILVLFIVSLYRYFGNGPYWNQDHVIDLCERNWWSTLLYINNYIHPGEMCLGHSWYLAVDTQLFFISPVFLILLWKYKIFGFIPLIGLIIASMGFIFIKTLQHNFHLNVLELNENDFGKQELIYYSTHSRISAWLIGIILGYLIFKYRNTKIKIRKLMNAINWILAFSIIIAIIFGPYYRAKNQPNSKTTIIEVACYEAFSRTFWAIAISWIIFACHKGYGGIINKILSLTIWKPLAHLTYSIYLNHILIQMILVGNSKSDYYFSNLEIILRFWGSFGLTLIVSVFTVLTFERPFQELEKIILKKYITN